MIRYILLLILITGISIQAQDTLTILQLNDTHSTLAPYGNRDDNLVAPNGGIARAVTEISLTKLTDKNVLTVHSGDFFIGDMFFNMYFGVPELQILNLCGLDAMAVGNHEFDLQPETLYGSLAAAFAVGSHFPLLSANMIIPDTGVSAGLKDYIHSYTIKQIGNIKVGIFGLTTPSTNVFSLPAPVVLTENILEIAQQMVDTLKSKGCNVIVLLSHLGVELDKAIAANVPDISVIAGGHDHILLNPPLAIKNPSGKNTLITQCGCNYSDIGKLKLSINGSDVELVSFTMIPLDKNVPEEPSTKATVDQLIAGIESTYGPMYTQKIAEATDDFEELSDLTDKNKLETSIGDLITDAFIWKTHTDIAIEVNGSIAMKLFKGPLVAADVFRAVGYGFNLKDGLGYRLMTYKIKGIDIENAFNFCLENLNGSDEMLPQVSGMSYSFDLSKPQGEKLLSVNITNGSPLDTGKYYSVTTNEFLYYALTTLIGSQPTEVYSYSDSSEYSVILDYIINHSPISPKIEGRIVPVENKNTENPTGYKLYQNFPNPFNPTTIIKYNNDKAGFVKIRIYDILGKEVRELINEYQYAGEHKIVFDASGLVSGIYFYVIQTGNFRETKKMVFLK